MSQVTMPMLVRMRELSDANLSYGAIAAVISLDWGREITEGQVRYNLRFHGRERRAGGRKAAGVSGLAKVSGRRFERVGA